MNPLSLLDGTSAAIVVGGTLLATVLRSGMDDIAVCIRALAGLARPRFRAEQARAELAAEVSQIRRDGLLRADPRALGDREFNEATGALIHTRSLAGLLEAHEKHRSRRLSRADRAVRVLAQAAELAPVFGLAGTLISLSQLPVGGISRGAFGGAISMAVLTTLYGLLLANMVLAPLARMIERQAQREERERQDVIDWLAWQVSPVCPDGFGRAPRGADSHRTDPEPYASSREAA